MTALERLHATISDLADGRTGPIASVLATAIRFRFFAENFALSCFRSASRRYGNAKSAPTGALQVTDNTIFFGCGGRI